MTGRYVLDASALLALLHDESGADAVAALLSASTVSAVNWSEVVQKAGAHGVPTAGLADDMRALGVEIAAFDEADAEEAASLWHADGRRLSLADRACLATARRMHWVAVTADRTWKDVELGVDVLAIR